MLDFLTLRRAWFAVSKGSPNEEKRVRSLAPNPKFLFRTKRGALADGMEFIPRGGLILVPGYRTDRTGDRGFPVYVLDWDAALDGGTLEPWKP